MAPFDVNALSGTIAYALVFGAIGFGFGAVLELAGFGDTRKLAAQFYLSRHDGAEGDVHRHRGGRGARGRWPRDSACST